MVIFELIYNLAVLVALSVLSGFIETRFARDNIKGKILQGTLFGATAIIGMMYPFVLKEGIIFDGRSIVISICTLFFGPVSGAIAAIAAITYRSILGGGGALIGILTILSSFFIGLIFYFPRLKLTAKQLTKIKLYFFGVIVHIVMLMLFLLLPVDTNSFKTIAVTVIVFYPFATVLIGKILLDQEENQNYIKKLKESEKLFRTTLYSIGDGVITTDTAGKVRQMNSIAENLTGWNEDEAAGKNIEEIFNIIQYETKAKVKNPIWKVLEEGKIIELAKYTSLISKSREVIPIADSSAPIRNESGAVEGAVLVFRDKTEEYHIEKNMRQSSARLKRAEFISKAGNWEIKLDSDIVRFSEGAAKIIGINDTQYKLSDIKKMVLEDYDNILKKGFNILIEKDQPHEAEFKIRKANSHELIDILLIAEFDDKEKKFFGIIQDITERKNWKEKIKTSEIRFRSVWENSADGMRLTDANGIILLVNNSFCDMVGLDKSKLEGKPSSIIYSAEKHNDILKKHKSRFAAKLVDIHFEREMKLWNGNKVWFEVTNSFIETENQQTMLLSIYRDITARKQAETELIFAKERAEEMNRLKTNFLANLSHELRTPMIGILGYADILSEELENSEYLEMIHTIRASGDRLLRMLNLLLDLSRIESNREDLKYQTLNVPATVEKIIESFDAFAKNKNLELKAIASNINLYVNLDERIFDQILNNLINNALKFTHKGSVIVRIDEEINNDTPWVLIKIIDTGIGIKSENIKVIFDEFRQVSEGLNRSYEGSGLGLTITKRSVELMNGIISVESKEGNGSTFTVKFPAAGYLPKAPNSSEKVNTRARKQLPNHFNRNILIVENDRVSANFIKYILRNYRSLDIAENGETAVRLASQKNYSIILMDIGLGIDMNGVEAAAKIRKLEGYKNVVMIAVTGFAMKGDEEFFLSSGFTHYLSKPYSRKELLEILMKS